MYNKPASEYSMANRRYSIYADRSGHLVLHCTGFSWIAAIFPPMWAVPRRLWLPCLGWLAVSLGAKALLLTLLSYLPILRAAGVVGIYLGVVLVEYWALGRFANPFHRWWLQRNGYFLVAAPLPPERAAT